MCMLCLCEYMLYVLGYPQRPEDGVRTPGTGVTSGFEY